MPNLIDQTERLQALDPKHSFIVQAPAGSGKTELLVQRYLSLLAHVNNPEEILAITFTRKAANEMRARILLALQMAQHENDNNYQLQTRQLAINALQHAEQLQWNLLENPARLRVYTIDAFSRHLTQQMPILSNFSAQFDTIDDAENLYQQAVDALLNGLESDEAWVNSLEKLLLYLDNDFKKTKNLFAEMLAQRDQWLPKILSTHSSADLRQTLEQALNAISHKTIKECQKLFPAELFKEALELMAYAHTNLAKPVITHLSNFDEWLIFANFLLTKSDQTWRKKIDITIGFPPGKNHDLAAQMKERMLILLKELQAHDSLRIGLENILLCPAPHYSDEQWELLESLLELLPILAAKLILTFANAGKIDFIQIAAAANQALHESEGPSELALRLDYQIRHILIDEFQDTSQTQFRLLTALTNGWQPGDKKTLFLVGDPMQSIYLFRQAEVGLFLYARQHSVNHIQLTPLQLQVNFRSEAGIVTWLNKVFPLIFPKQEDITTGAITYSPSVAKNNNKNPEPVHFYSCVDMSRTLQAQQLIQVINNIQANNPTDSIAILVRSRSHLIEIINELKISKLGFQGVEIDKLSAHYVIQDLFALTRALLHLNDRVAWLAILRAPWCGLTLADLHALANTEPNLSLWANLINYQNNPAISQDGLSRLKRIVPVLQQSLSKRGRINLRPWLELTWLNLGGPAAILNQDDLRYAKCYFDLLEAFNVNEGSDEISWLKNKIDNLYAPTDSFTYNTIQIMTLHKAKGLEFDHVLLPALDRVGRNNTKKLLMWMERTTESNVDDFIMAPITALNDQKDLIYHYLQRQQKIKLENEIKRQLYVAATRAKKSLHLFANLNKAAAKPKTNSFLELLWPFYRDQFEANSNESEALTETPNTIAPLIRLKSNWEFPQ